MIRATSVRLPLRAFFQFSGVVLFGMAVIFAGNAIYALQEYGLLKTTYLSGPGVWLGRGIPMLGLYPNVQTLSIQGLLLSGAVLALAAGADGPAEGRGQRLGRGPSGKTRRCRTCSGAGRVR